MKRNAYVKNQIRIIKKTKARFLSIFCIVFLGASFFAGLRQSPLIMKESMHDYLQTYKWNDLNYIATYGFFPIEASPPAKVTACPSAIPTSTALLGNFSKNSPSPVPFTIPAEMA